MAWKLAMPAPLTANESNQKARRWKLSALKAQRPDWSEIRLGSGLALIYLRGDT